MRWGVLKGEQLTTAHFKAAVCVELLALLNSGLVVWLLGMKNAGWASVAAIIPPNEMAQAIKAAQSRATFRFFLTMWTHQFRC